MKSLPVCFCCNDYRNGCFQGWFDVVHVERYEAEIDCSPMVLRDLGGGRVRIGRRVFRYTSVVEWYGNWCWDRYWIVDAHQLIRYLRERGARCGAGHSRFYRWFNAQETAA